MRFFDNLVGINFFGSPCMPLLRTIAVAVSGAVSPVSGKLALFIRRIQFLNKETNIDREIKTICNSPK